MSDCPSLLQRLRDAGLRPTTARIGILQVIQAAGACGVAADEVFRQMLLRGTRVSVSTVYRAIQQLEFLGVLLQGRSEHSLRTLYRLGPAAQATEEVRMACRGCARSVALPGAQLRSEVERRAAEQGMHPAVGALVVQVDCLAPQTCRAGTLARPAS
ncbi:Fur family transcriptional regulator [Acidovorax sp.]|uniref:Fur family transcriptional regulator n=1 Tax=Acidovorax sp. TaxID=1872122 RepID=UPI002ACEE575|nr:transcriptional repressor [Acidovorax sp.]MDZ7864972.1 transcriptional repressor [Acidovorax sp.]